MTDLGFQPRVFGPYYLLEQIAFGGMAQIYRARAMGASGFQRELVLKLVLQNLVENADFLAMLSNEAKLTALLQHGNIAQVYELGLIDGTYFITMEYVEGVSLKDIFRQASKAKRMVPGPLVCHLVSEMCAGLDYAHRKTDSQGNPLRIVHCDISPDNVIISYEGVVKVLDFGIARAAAAFSNYKEGMVMGKFNYVAPEQAMGGAVDARADVFACGIILYEGLTGEHPFGRKGDVDTLIRIARFEKGELTPIRQHNPSLPVELESVVMKALAGNRDERYPSCRHLAADLAPFVGDRAAVAVGLVRELQETFDARIAERRVVRGRDDEVVRKLQQAQALEPERASKPAQATAAPQRRRGGGTAAILGTAVLALGGGLAGGYALRGAPSASVVILADADGAQVRVDRRALGAAPVVLEGLDGGVPILVEVEAPGRKPFTQTFAPGEGSVSLVRAKLAANVGSLRLETDPPGATVHVDGKAMGIAPLLLDALELGVVHRFRLELEGYPTQEFSQAFQRAANDPLRISLRR